MARKKYLKPETRAWDAPKPVVEVAVAPEVADPPCWIENVDGVPIEIRKRPGFGLVMRPPSYTAIGPDGKPYTERLVASAYYWGHYQPWRRRQRGHTAPEAPSVGPLDGLLPDITEEDNHDRLDASE